MIYSIEGDLVSLRKADGFCFVVIRCSIGVSFELKVSYNTSKAIEGMKEVFLYTNLVFRESYVEFFGFSSFKEKETFKMLTGVSGVGPSFAISILSNLTPLQLFEAVIISNTKRLCECKGIGKKTANRIILELKDKINIEKNEELLEDSYSNNMKNSENRYIFDEALEALISLGYSKKEASKVVYSQKEADSVELLIKNSLLLLSKK